MKRPDAAPESDARILQDDAIDVGLAFRRLVRGWWRIGLLAASGAAVMAGVAYLMTPVYRVQVVLAPVTEDKSSSLLSSLQTSLGGLASLAGLDIGSDGSSKAVAIATLKSRAMAESFIRERGLMQRFFADAWDAQAQRWRVADPADAPTMDDAYRYFDEEIRFVSEDALTGLVTFSIEWTDPQEAADWAMDYVARTNARLRADAIENARRSIDYLQGERTRTTVVEVQQGIYRLIEAHLGRITLANAREEYAFKVVDPAVVPDPDRFERPKRLLMIVLGCLLGAFLGALLVLYKA